MADKRKQKNLNNALSLMAKSSFLVLITVASSKILTYLYKVVLAREYGAETYGVYILSLMILGWLAIFSKLGFSEGLPRFIPFYKSKKENSKISYIIKRSLLISGSLSIFAGILLFLASSFIAVKLFGNPELATFLKIFSFAIPFTVISSIYIAILRSYEEIFWMSFIGNILQSIVNLGVILVLIAIGTGSIAISISYTTGMFVVLITSYFIVMKKVKLDSNLPVSKKERQAFKEFSSYSTPLIFFGIIVSILHWTDSFMIGILRSVEEVGFYNAAVPIALLITISIDLFRQLFLPMVTKEYSSGEVENVKQLSKQIGKWVYMVSLPALILFLLYPEFFIGLLFGEEFIVAANSLRILAIGAMFVSLFEVSKDLLSMQGKSRLVLKDTLVAFLINIVLNLILISRMGINGAAIATTVSLAVLGIIFAYQANQDLKIIPLRKKMINLSFAGIVSAILVLLVGKIMPSTTPWMFARLILFSLTYLIFILLFKGLDKNDKVIISLVKSKFSRRKSINPRTAVISDGSLPLN